MGSYTSLIALAITCVVMFSVGLFFAERERKEHQAKRLDPSRPAHP